VFTVVFTIGMEPSRRPQFQHRVTLNRLQQSRRPQRRSQLHHWLTTNRPQQATIPTCEDATALAGPSSFWDHVVIPRRTKRNQKPRKKAPYNLTGTEHFKFMADRAVPQKSAKKAQPGKLATDGVNKSRKRQAAVSKPASKVNKKRKGNEDSTDPCIFCCESTTATACIQYQSCGLWAHYECADVDKHIFAYLCEVCQ